MSLSRDDICFGELEIRAHEHVAAVRGAEVPLTTREFDILLMLAEHPGWVYSSEQLAGDPDEGDHSPESVSVLISRLRHKLSEAGASEVVDTVRGVGYRLRMPDDDADPHASAVGRALRDAAWNLQEAVIEVEHAGTPEQQREAVEMLDETRRGLFARLAEPASPLAED